MPQAIAAVLVQYAGFTAIAANVVATVLVVAATYVYGQSQQRRNERRARDAYNASLQDRQLVIRSAVAPARRIYGRDRVGGQLVFAHTSGDKGEFLHLVICHAYHRCDAYEALYFNEVQLPEPNASGFITSGQFAKRIVHTEIFQAATDGAGTLWLPYPTTAQPVVTTVVTSEGVTELGFTHTVGTQLITGLPPSTAVVVTYTREEVKSLVRVRRYLGTQTTADADLVAECGGAWTSEHVGFGCTYTAWRVEYDHDVFGAVGLPSINAVLRGALLADPRTNTTAWSDNAALVVADWLRHSDGLAQSASQVPDDEVIAAANACDEPVPVNDIYSGTQLLGPTVPDAGAEWSATGATLTVIGSSLRLSATTGDPTLQRQGLSITGQRFVHVLVRRVAGSGWQGACYYSTSSHGWSESYRKDVAQPTWGADGWAVLTFDMHALTTGGTDWQANTITGLRFDIGSSAADVFEVAKIVLGGSTTQPRYTFNGSFTYDLPPKEWLSDMAMSMAGAAVYVQGRWLVRPGVYRTPAITIDGHSLAGSMQVQPKAARASLFNAVRATYRDPDAGYVEVQAPVVENAQYAVEDGAPVPPRDIQIPFLADTHRAQRLAKIELERGRQAMTVALTANLRAYNLAPTDTVWLDFPEWFGAPKAFEVVERTYRGGLEIDYTLREISPSAFAWALGQATIGDPAPDTTLPPVTAPGQLVGLTAIASTNDAMPLGSGSRLSRVRVAWAPVADVAVAQGGWVEVEYYTGGRWVPAPTAAGGDTSVDIVPAPVGAVTIRARAVNALGMRGPWALIGASTTPSVIDTGTIAPGAATSTVTAGPTDGGYTMTGSQILTLPTLVSSAYTNNAALPQSVEVYGAWRARARLSGSWPIGTPRHGVKLTVQVNGTPVYPPARAPAGPTSDPWYADGMTDESLATLDGSESAPVIVLQPGHVVTAQVSYGTNVSAAGGVSGSSVVDLSWFAASINMVVIKR